MGIDTKIMPLSYLEPEIMAAILKSKMAADKRKSQPGKLLIMILEIRRNILIPLASCYPKCLAEPLFWISAPWLWSMSERSVCVLDMALYKTLYILSHLCAVLRDRCFTVCLSMRFVNGWTINVVSDIAIFVLKRDVKLQLTNEQ